MVARYNADLANNFGNLANRVLNMAVTYCDGVVPDARADGPLVEHAATAFATLTLVGAFAPFSALAFRSLGPRRVRPWCVRGRRVARRLDVGF